METKVSVYTLGVGGMTVNVKNTQRYKNTKALPSFPNIIATK
jgi:hypothetical protein